MIVNPQLFNYRLIIGSLIITVASISTVGYFSYQSLETEKKFLENENQLIRKELDQVLDQYDEITGINNELKQEIENSQKIFQDKFDSLTSLAAIDQPQNVDASIFSASNKSNNYLKDLSDSLKQENQNLSDANSHLEEELANARSKNSRLVNEIERIKDVDETPSVSVDRFTVATFRMSSGKKVISAKASTANTFQVCMEFSSKSISNIKGDIYIQILDPNNNVVADKGAVTFGNASLIYSGKYNIANLLTTEDVCLNIETDQNDRPLKKGHYRVNVFHDKTMLGNTTVELN